MVTFLAGGTGTPKLLDGATRVWHPDEIAVVANTGDDIELGGHLVCPDVDTVLFAGGGVLDRETWWGIADDTTTTHEELRRLATQVGLGTSPRYLDDKAQTAGREIARWRRFSGVGEFMEIGDRDARSTSRARACSTRGTRSRRRSEPSRTPSTSTSTSSRCPTIRSRR